MTEDNKVIKRITEKIERFDSFEEYNVEDFATFGGDADNITKSLSDEDIKIAQLRKFFSAIKRIELDCKEVLASKEDEEGDSNQNNVWDEKIKTRFYLLMPQLAYAKGRKLISENFYTLLEVSMNRINDYNDFKRFVEFLEAIIAFHKANHK